MATTVIKDTSSFGRLVDIVRKYLKKSEPKNRIISIPYFPGDMHKKNYNILRDELLRDLRESRLEIPNVGEIAGAASEISLNNCIMQNSLGESINTASSATESNLSAIDTRALRERYLEILQNRAVHQNVMNELEEEMIEEADSE